MINYPNEIKIGDAIAGDGNKIIVAGPCVIEDFSMLEKTAAFLKDIASKRKIPVVLKASYDKANRTSVSAFRGPGIEKGLEMIAAVKKKLSLPVLVDIHCRQEAVLAAKVADCLQIPAFLCRQTDLLASAGKTGLPVNIKKGQFISPRAMRLQGEKALEAGSGGVIFTERGTSFGYNDLIVDMRSIVIMKETGGGVFFDVTHSQQSPPSGTDTGTSGSRKFTIPLCCAALAAGADGIYAEVHPCPSEAKSDRDTQLSFREFEGLVDAVSEM